MTVRSAPVVHSFGVLASRAGDARLVDLAQSAIPKTELTIHELTSTRPELVVTSPNASAE